MASVENSLPFPSLPLCVMDWDRREVKRNPPGPRAILSPHLALRLGLSHRTPAVAIAPEGERALFAPRRLLVHSFVRRPCRHPNTLPASPGAVGRAGRPPPCPLPPKTHVAKVLLSVACCFARRVALACILVVSRELHASLCMSCSSRALPSCSEQRGLT